MLLLDAQATYNTRSNGCPIGIQEQPKHLLKEKRLDGSGNGMGSGFLQGRCLKKAFTAPVTPSSFFIALASSTA
uniref:Sterol 3-beta-glucosyltransferase UGT80A2-like n=1 Tax=Rhizophora mucronata TaxID=61149 RepID=A0A2P2KYJ6_RHIMU